MVSVSSSESRRPVHKASSAREARAAAAPSVPSVPSLNGAHRASSQTKSQHHGLHTSSERRSEPRAERLPHVTKGAAGKRESGSTWSGLPPWRLMKIAAFTLFAALATSKAFSLGQWLDTSLGLDRHPQVLGEIPGNAPIETCLDDEPQLVRIEELVIDPSPPVPGENLTVSAKGVLEVDITEGAYVDVLVRYGYITLVNRRYDLCELLPEVDLECPVPAGFLSLSRSVEIPENVPPGQYSVEVKAYTEQDALLSCLSGVLEIE